MQGREEDEMILYSSKYIGTCNNMLARRGRGGYLPVPTYVPKSLCGLRYYIYSTLHVIKYTLHLSFIV